MMDIPDLDPECQELVYAMNLFDGICTNESCCGHGERSFCIWFRAENLECLPDLLYWFAGCHCGSYHWKVIAKTDCGKSPVSFMVKGPKGKKAYREARRIARYMVESIEESKT